MNQALTATHDGIAGYWDGTANLPTKQRFGIADDSILYLRYSTRGLMLDHELFSNIRVESKHKPGAKTGIAEVFQGTQSLVTIKEPDIAVFKDQLQFLRSYADLRDDRISEISLQIDDILSFFGSIALIDDQRRLRTLELLEAVVRLCIFVELKVKHFCRAARPVDFATEVQPIIQTPDHSAFPSGHATEAFAVATVLHRLMKSKGPKDGISAHAQVFRLANRIAVNRTVAGVHFPVDSAAGAVLGCVLGEYVCGLGMGTAPLSPPTLTIEKVKTMTRKAASSTTPDAAATVPPVFNSDEDFTLNWLAEVLPDKTATAAGTLPSAILQAFWRSAKAEWP